MNNKKSVLILCTGNSARSQMAEGILRDLAGESFEVESAGTKPSHVRPEAIEALKGIGIDISGHRSKSLDEFVDHPFDYVITVCDNAKESCPLFLGRAERIHWSFEDPAASEGTPEEILENFRRIRDQISEKLRDFAGKHDQDLLVPLIGTNPTYEAVSIE